MDIQAIPTNDKDALGTLKGFTGLYLPLAKAQYLLSRQNDKSIKNSLADAHLKVREIATRVLDKLEVE